MSNGQHPPTKQPGPSFEAKLVVGVFGGAGLLMLLGAVALLFTRGFSSFLGLALFGSVFAGIGWLVYRNFIAPPGMHWVFVDGKYGPESKLVEIGQDSTTAQREHAREQAEPWTARDNWRTGILVERGSGGLWIWIVAMVFTWAFTGGMAAALGFDRHFNPDWIMLAICGGMALWITAFLVYRIVHDLRFAVSELRLRETPVVPGQSMRAVLRTGVRGDKHPQAEFSVKLVCAKTVTGTYQAAGSGPGDAEKFRNSRLLVWEHENRQHGTLGADKRLQLDIVMAVPDNLPQSDEQRDGHRHQWLLRVECVLPGRNYSAEFELPVFRRQVS